MVEHPKNFSKSANRALDVLSYLAAVRAPARAADIADALGMARSSADQLLKSLVAGGYLVISTQDKTYFPSIRLAPFGRWISECYPVEAKLNAIVDDVHSQTGQVVTLSMQNDCYMQLMRVRCDLAESPILKVGATLPIMGSAVGGAALTTKTRDEIRKLMARARRQRAMADQADGLGPLIERVRHYRLSGYATRLTRNPTMNGLMDYWSIAMCVPQGLGDASMVLGFAGPAATVYPRETAIVSVMRETIRRHLDA